MKKNPWLKDIIDLLHEFYDDCVKSLRYTPVVKKTLRKSASIPVAAISRTTVRTPSHSPKKKAASGGGGGGGQDPLANNISTKYFDGRPAEHLGFDGDLDAASYPGWTIEKRTPSYVLLSNARGEKRVILEHGETWQTMSGHGGRRRSRRHRRIRVRRTRRRTRRNRRTYHRRR